MSGFRFPKQRRPRVRDCGLHDACILVAKGNRSTSKNSAPVLSVSSNFEIGVCRVEAAVVNRIHNNESLKFQSHRFTWKIERWQLVHRWFGESKTLRCEYAYDVISCGSFDAETRGSGTG